MENQKFLSVRDAARYLGVSPITLRVWMRQGLVPYTRLHRKILIPVEFLRDLERQARARVAGR